MIKLKDDSQKLKKEWEDLRFRNLKLYEITLEYTRISNILFGLDTVITDIFRTDDEHRNNLLKAKAVYYPSVHCYWRGVDVRDTELKDWQKEVLLLCINNTYKYDIKKPEKRTLIYHDIGLGSHGHLQTS